MHNRELAKVFEQIADLMEVAGGDRFRINSYRKTARIIDELPRDVADMLQSGELVRVPGIGKGTVGRIEEYLNTGTITVHQELLAKLPGGLLELLAISGMGPKTVALGWKELGIENVDDLKTAIDDGSLAALPGMGPKKVENIRHALAFRAAAAGRTPLGIALPIAEELVVQLRELPGVARAVPAGSLRRWCETVGDIDILVQADNGEATLEAFTRFPQVKDVMAAGSTKASVRVVDDVQVDVRVVPAESFGAALQYFTGSKAHNVRLRERAVKRKCKLNEYGLFHGDEQIAGRDEEAIYAKLGLNFVPPELREDRGEIDVAGKLPRLVRMEDMRGDLHMHTTASDGRYSIEEMIEACIERGYEYLCITEHSTSSRIANGLDAKRLKTHVKNVRKAAATYRKHITVYAGTEVDVLADESLDYDDALLADLDIVTASLHSALTQPADKITGRLLRAMDNRHVRIIGHPTGRLIGQREAADVDMNAVIEHARQTGTWLELNASWQRLDLKDVHVRQAKQAGVKIAICTDAHGIDQLDYLAFGVYTARRGWLARNDVINALPRAKFDKIVKAGK